MTDQTVPGAPALRRTNWTVNLICIIIGMILFALWAQPLLQRTMNGENDFLQLYAGATLVGTPDLYYIEASKRIHREVTSDSDWYPSIYYTRLPYYALLLKPLAKLPYRVAHAVWLVLNLAVFTVFVILAMRQFPETVVLVFLSVPVLVNFLNGQDVGLVTSICGFAMFLSARGRDFEAGLLMSLASIKFHVLILFPIALLMHRRWKFVQGGLAGAVVLLWLSFIADGWDWPRRFLAVVTNPELHPGPEHMVTFRNLVWFLTGGENRVLETALSIPIAGLYVYLASRIRDLGILFGLAIPAGLLICHHAYSQDLLLLLLSAVLFMIGPASRGLRVTTIAVGMPPTAFLLFSGYPYSAIVPLLLLSILLVAAVRDAHNPTSAHAGNAAA